MAQTELLSPEWLLFRTCQELVQRSRSSDLYDKIRMAGLLEHLLLGPMSLVARVNRDPALPLELWYREPEEDDAERWTSPLGFDASQRRAALGEVKKTALEPFLAARVLQVDSSEPLGASAPLRRWLSVEQLVRTVSHCYGGVHSPPPAGVPHEVLRAIDRVARSGHASAVAVALHEISGVTLRALLPLAEAKGHVTERSRERPAPSPMAPAGSGCPFAGKIPLDE
jgi:hypothetical protein